MFDPFSRCEVFWDRIFIVEFAYISRKFPADSGFFPPPKRRNICTAIL
jgi:hypothetical protein